MVSGYEVFLLLIFNPLKMLQGKFVEAVGGVKYMNDRCEDMYSFPGAFQM